MSPEEIAKHRRSLWLRSERAFGLESVGKIEAARIRRLLRSFPRIPRRPRGHRNRFNQQFPHR